jgi:hypothetical protein
MLDGVVVDDLTRHFLQVAADDGRSSDLSQTLRVFFHDARNRLNSLKIGLYLARRAASMTGAIWDELDQSYRGLEQLVDRLQMICRRGELATISGDVGHWLEERRPIWASKLGTAGRRLDWAPPAMPAIGHFDPMRLIQGLDALVAWRAGEGGHDGPVLLTWRRKDDHFHVEWSEEGLRPEQPLEGRDGRSVSMALPLLAHIMTAHGGSLSVSGRGGLVVRMTWPANRARSGPP